MSVWHGDRSCLFLPNSRAVCLQHPLNLTLQQASPFNGPHRLSDFPSSLSNPTAAAANAYAASLPCIAGLAILTGAHSSPAVQNALLRAKLDSNNIALQRLP
jgi:hypothetical protein